MRNRPYIHKVIRIIIYDDSVQRRESLKALLSLTDNIECVADFPDCSHVLKDMEQHTPDVVLMDIEMPFVDGIDGVGIIKKDFPDIRIIMQTVFDDDDKIFASICAGASGYLLKKTLPSKILD